MKYIIRESKLKYLRRIDIIDKLIKESMDEFDRWHFSKVTVDYMIRYLTLNVTERYFFKFSEEPDIVSVEEYDELKDFLEPYLENFWRERIEKEIKKHRG